MKTVIEHLKTVKQEYERRKKRWIRERAADGLSETEVAICDDRITDYDQHIKELGKALSLLSGDLSEVSNEDLKKTLEARGYYTESLWHIDDVRGCEPGMDVTDGIDTSKSRLTDDQCFDILKGNLSGYIVQQINEGIADDVREKLSE